MITACYIHVPGDPEHERQAREYLASVKANPPGCDHRNLIICQSGEPTSEFRSAFKELPNCEFFLHDDTGWDIGGYIAAARSVKTPIMLCMGGSTTVRGPNWLSRMVECWLKHGPGFHGTLSSYQCRPHFNTNGFFCAPDALIKYPKPVTTKAERYEFEHGAEACWWQIYQQGFPAKLVTWDGEYDWTDWRKPQNISCRGDQSNCLLWFRINYWYEYCRHHDAQSKANLEYLTDHHVLDPNFRAMLGI